MLRRTIKETKEVTTTRVVDVPDMVQYKGEYYKVLPEPAEASCGGCVWEADDNVGCDDLCTDMIDKGQLPHDCTTLEIIFEKVDSLYQDLLKVKEITDDKSKNKKGGVCQQSPSKG